MILALAALAAAVPAAASPAPSASAGCPITLTDVARKSGIDFRHERGATPQRRLPETMGSGVAWLDYDADGWMDLYVVQSGPFPPTGSAAAGDRLYRNNHDGTFTDVTQKAGLRDTAYGMGAAAADYDNDGFPDLYVTNFGANILYHNNGDGTFTDVTARAGVAASGWSTSAAWADVDGDGFLDLFVARYVDYSVEKDYFCGNVAAGVRDYCHPSVYPPASGILYRNNGNGTFTDVTKEAGVGAPGKELAVGFLDFDLDGKPDLFVANDTVGNFLFHNLGHGKFEDVSLTSGTAFSLEGKPQGGMGVGAADFDGDGLPDLVVTYFDFELNGYYHNLGSGVFEDLTVPSGFGGPSLNFLAFGIGVLDLDDRGVLDAYIANGHLQDPTRRENTTYAERDFLMWNDGHGRFHEQGCGPAFDQAFVGRGVAVADYDNDGDPDVAVSNSGGPLQLLRNDGTHGRWAGVVLVGTRSNRQGIGARLTAELPSGRKLTRWVQSGDSYLSSSDPRVLFGLGGEASIRSLTIDWPSGTVQRVGPVAAGQYTKITEPRTP
ncbi:MAG TPA: CRTAC1 family protein [Thermoanaerobaculia bacterium]|nr:CRTAC1 family protein [Thermoanaerobaculia bacterium]